MKIGIVITTYNRPEYTKICFDSIKSSNLLGDVFIVLVDDCSKNSYSNILFNSFFIEGLEVVKIKNEKNLGISKSLLIGFNEAIKNGADVLINLDNDVIVKQDWLKKLIDLYSCIEDECFVVSGFNTISADLKTKKIRHPIIKVYDSYYEKKSIGGINMMFSVRTYLRHIKPSLDKRGHWDWNVCSRGIKFYVTKPSVIQHIGIEKATNKNNPDIAFDFYEQNCYI